MNEDLKAIHEKLVSIQKRILSMRGKVPIGATNSHCALRNLETMLDHSVTNLTNATTSLTSECPDLMKG